MENDNTFAEMIGINNETNTSTEVVDTDKDTNTTEKSNEDFTVVKAELTGLKGEVTGLKTALDTLNRAMSNLNVNNQKTVEKAESAKLGFKEKYDRLIASGVSEGQISVIEEVLGANFADVNSKLQQLDQLTAKLESYDKQINNISRSTGAAAFSNSVDKLSNDPAYNSPNSPLTFQEWREEQLTPALNDPNLDPVVANALLQDPENTLRFLYEREVGKAALSPDKAKARQQAREKAIQRKIGAGSPGGQGSALKGVDKSDATPKTYAERMQSTLLSRVRL